MTASVLAYADLIDRVIQLRIERHEDKVIVFEYTGVIGSERKPFR